jgi:hypothetical protein
MIAAMVGMLQHNTGVMLKRKARQESCFAEGFEFFQRIPLGFLRVSGGFLKRQKCERRFSRRFWGLFGVVVPDRMKMLDDSWVVVGGVSDGRKGEMEKGKTEQSQIPRRTKETLAKPQRRKLDRRTWEGEGGRGNGNSRGPSMFGFSDFLVAQALAALRGEMILCIYSDHMF